MFKVGQTVRYSQVGVCRVEKICQLTVGRDVESYYALMPLYKKGSTVYVPLKNEQLTSKMLPLLTKEEIEETLLAVQEKKTEWIRDFRKRSEFAKTAMQSADRKEALFLIKSIYCRRRQLAFEGIRSHTTDDYFLKEAEELVYGEFAHVWQMPLEEVRHLVQKRFEQNG